MSKIFKHSFISKGKFFAAGIPIEENDIRPFMMKYEAKETRPSAPMEISLTHRLNERYSVDEDGLLRPSVGQQAAQMEAEAKQQDFVDSLGNEPPSESVQAAIEEIREDHQADMQKQIAQAKYLANHSDELNHSLIQEHEERLNSGEFDVMDSDPPPTPKAQVQPAAAVTKPKWRYVKRGSVFRRVKNRAIKLRIGEPVFVRGSNGFEKIGVVKQKIENETSKGIQ